jgi:hypothetical protein
MGISAPGQPPAARPARWPHPAGALLLCALAALGGCSGDDSNPFSAFANLSSSASVQDYSLAATINGLISSGLVLTVNAQAVSVRPGMSTAVLASSLPAGGRRLLGDGSGSTQR